MGAYRFLQRVWRLVVDEITGESRIDEQLDEHAASAPRFPGRPDAADAALGRSPAFGMTTESAHTLAGNTAAAKLIETRSRSTNHLTKPV